MIFIIPGTAVTPIRRTYLTPVGDFADSPGPYGTYDMGGDVFQWNESIFRSRRGSGGGSWDDKYGFDLGSASSSSCLPLAKYSNVGFRVASEAVPEPGSLALLLAVRRGVWNLETTDVTQLRQRTRCAA